LMMNVAATVAVLVVLTFVNIPGLDQLSSQHFISLPQIR
jgi:hypothetical protein